MTPLARLGCALVAITPLGRALLAHVAAHPGGTFADLCDAVPARLDVGAAEVDAAARALGLERGGPRAYTYWPAGSGRHGHSQEADALGARDEDVIVARPAGPLGVASNDLTRIERVDNGSGADVGTNGGDRHPPSIAPAPQPCLVRVYLPVDSSVDVPAQGTLPISGL